MAIIHFLNVGHGDCTVIEHNDGNLTMIDINNGSELDEEAAKPILEGLARSPERYLGQVMAGQNGYKSWQTLLSEAGYAIALTNPVEFFKNRFPDRPIFRFIQTHPDLDHMRGLAALEASGIKVLNFWDTRHSRQWDDEKDAEIDKADWEAYESYRSGRKTTVLHLHRGDKGKFYNQDEKGADGGNGLHILSPTPDILREFDKDKKRNDLSYVIRYITGKRTIIFGGDAEQAAWESIFNRYGGTLKCDVLKASHHGRDTGYHQEAVKAMSPEFAIVSVGKKPGTDATNKYRTYCKNVWSTRWFGNLTLEINADDRMIWKASETRYTSPSAQEQNE
jgi:beta-lactamase superfamily II metal-dependent hydrolase